MESRSIKKGFIGWLALVIAISAGAEARAQTELSLRKAIEMALEHSYSYAAAGADSISAYYDYRSAKALRYPSLSLNANAFYTDEVQEIVTPLAAIAMGAHENYSAELKLWLPLYSGGRISNQIKMQNRQYKIKSDIYEAQRLSTAWSTRRGYLSVLQAEAVAAVATASYNRIEIIRADIENLYRNGVADSLDLLEAESSLGRTEKTRIERISAFRNAELLLGKLIGWETDQDILLNEGLNEPEEKENYLWGDDSTGYRNRPELKALKSRTELSKSFYSLNKAGYFPSLNGFTSYVYGKPNKDLTGNSWNDYLVFGLNLSWEFNLGFKTKQNVSSSRYQIRVSELNLKETEESLQLAAKVARNNLEMALESFRISKREYAIAESKYRLSMQRHKAGKLSSNRALEMEEELTSAEESLKISLLNYYLAEADYLYAIASPRIYGGL